MTRWARFNVGRGSAFAVPFNVGRGSAFAVPFNVGRGSAFAVPSNVGRGSAFPSLLVSAVLLLGCYEGRFPVCRTNADCEGRDAGKLGNICFDLRCVECRYDVDCPAGQVCGATQSCASISEPPAGSAQEAAPTWEPTPGASGAGAGTKKRPPKGAPKAPPPKQP